jgi:hypothetical protein
MIIRLLIFTVALMLGLVAVTASIVSTRHNPIVIEDNRIHFHPDLWV